MTNESDRSQIAILAGGMGTRLKSRTGDLPKPMAPILERPVLEHLIEMCRRNGFTRIALLVHYGSDVIRARFGDGERLGVHLTYCVETEPRGTAGALRDALGRMAERFIVLYGDTYADVNLRALWDHHAASGAAATLLLHPNDHPHDSDLVEVDAAGQVVAVHAYPHPPEAVYANLVNAALYVLQRDALPAVIPESGRSDLAKQTFPAMLAAGHALQAYVTPEYIKDMGTPARLDKVERDIVAGLPERLSDRQLRSAVFLDRDGTLNVEVTHLREPSQLVLLPGAGEAVRALNRAGLLAVGVTNQPVLARGDVTWSGLARIHATLDQRLGEHGGWLDRLYVCPHHPDKGFAGEVSELKIHCDCRKPETGLIDRAVRELGISRRQSWMVGDTTSDVRAAARAGLRSILVRTGHAGLDAKYPDQPDYTAPDLSAAVDWILHGHASTARQLLGLLARAAQARLILIGGAARSGKSSTAQVLAEQLALCGRNAHVIALDGWLKPAAQRCEGAGVLERFDLQAFAKLFAPLMGAADRRSLDVPIYNRALRTAQTAKCISVGADDLLIVEGVPALLDAFLLANSTVRIFVEAGDVERAHRLAADYAWRGIPSDTIAATLASRDQDELPAVLASAVHATDRVQGTSPA